MQARKVMSEEELLLSRDLRKQIDHFYKEIKNYIDAMNSSVAILHMLQLFPVILFLLFLFWSLSPTFVNK